MPPVHQNDGVTRSPQPRRIRGARGPVVASAGTAAALLSHLLGGGAMPGWLGIVVPLALALTVCTALAGRRLSLWRTTASVALSQVLFHTLFVLGTPRAAGAPSGTVGYGAHGRHGAQPLPPSADASPPFGTNLTGPDLIGTELIGAELVGASTAMWFWHGVAAVATVFVLYSGERELSRLRALAGRLAGWLRHRLAVPVAPVSSFPVVRMAAPDWFTGSFPTRPEVTPSRRRGPPHVLAI